MTTMSPQATSSPPRNVSNVSDNPARLNNDLQNGSQTPNDPSTMNFGWFHNNVQSDIGNLELASNSISNLAKIFRQQEDIIKWAQKNWIKNKDLEKENQRLKTASEEMWRIRHKHEEQQKNKILELEEQAAAGERAKRGFERQKVALKEEYNKKEQTLKQEREEARRQDQEELEQKKIQLERDYASEITELKTQKLTLEAENTGLKETLQQRSTALEEEIETSKRVRESLYKEISSLKAELKEIETNHATEAHPDEYQYDLSSLLMCLKIVLSFLK